MEDSQRGDGVLTGPSNFAKDRETNYLFECSKHRGYPAETLTLSGESSSKRKRSSRPTSIFMFLLAALQKRVPDVRIRASRLLSKGPGLNDAFRVPTFNEGNYKGQTVQREDVPNVEWHLLRINFRRKMIKNHTISPGILRFTDLPFIE